MSPLKMFALLLAMVAAAANSQTFPSTSPPSPIKTTTPTYTTEALDARLEGIVVLSFTVEADGTPSAIRVVRGLGKGLDEEAIECLEQWRFKPATNGGEPIPSRAQAEIHFRIPGK